MEGKSPGRMLVQLVRANSSSSVVPTIVMEDLRVCSHGPEIVGRFREMYEDLYSSWQKEMGDEMDTFFEDLMVPFLSEKDRNEL